VEITACIGEEMRFVPGESCDSLEPPCGVILGACCFPDATCTIETQEDCGTLGGDWLGKDSICASCPCITPCPDGGTAEGEPTCYDGYVDEFNSGCSSVYKVFSPIAPGETVCGESGIFEFASEPTPDWDWWEIYVYDDTTLTWTVEAEFRPRIWIIDGSKGCPGTILAQSDTYECETNVVAASVAPGRYWLVVAPWAFTDSAACGARYVGTVTLDPYCAGDVDGSGDVDVVDLLALLGAWGPCPAPCPEDVDQDGVVDVKDLLIVLGSWGAC